MVNKHFFKPLLHGFHTHLTIPVAFFLKYIEGRSELKMVKLRSDVSESIWEVKLEDNGQKLTDGWEEFTLAHDLRIGDILIFRQEIDMSFHVTILGPSCCEIQYESCLDDRDNNLKKNSTRREESSSLDHSCFVANVAPSSLRYDTLYFPKRFTRENRIDTSCGDIVLMNEKDKSWTLALKQKNACGTIYITRGWRSFCGENGLKVGDSFTFKMMQRRGTLVLRLLTTESEQEEEEEEEEESSEDYEVESLSKESDSDEEINLDKIQRKKKNPKAETESSSVDTSFFVANVTSSALRSDTLNLPKPFARANRLDKRCGEIVLMNQKAKSWNLCLKRKNSRGTVYITRGWRKFCRDNGLRAGGFYTFKLIQSRETLVLRLSEEEEEEEESVKDDEINSLSAGQETDVEKRLRKRKYMWEASSSASQNRFVTLTLTSHNLKKSLLYLPVRFTRFHGINEETRMSMLDKHGTNWSTQPRSEKNCDRIRLARGWKEFFKANCVEKGESAVVELIWERDTSCVLKFCSKVKQEI
ncbi:unnamed protein product [Cochlearia groenlandica]